MMSIGKVMKATISGIGPVDGYGPHPGLAPLIMIFILGLVAGGLTGGLFMLLIFGPVFLLGAYERGKNSDALLPQRAIGSILGDTHGEDQS